VQPRYLPAGVWIIALVAGAAAALSTRASARDPAAESIDRFLAQSAVPHTYRAIRRLSAENGPRVGWTDAVTEYAPETGFRYHITGEGGSGYICNNVLHAVLDEERDIVSSGALARAELTPANYIFETEGLRPDGLLKVLIAPRRSERALVDGALLLEPASGEPVRLEARLAKNPSFWVTNVMLVRRYQRVAGVVMPISVESTARIRMLGPASFRMTYQYLEIDRQPIAAP